MRFHITLTIGHLIAYNTVFFMFTEDPASMLIDVIRLPVRYEHFLVSPTCDWTITPWVTRSRHRAFHMLLPWDCSPCYPFVPHFRDSVSDQIVISAQWNDIEHMFSEHSDLSKQYLIRCCIQVDEPNARA